MHTMYVRRYVIAAGAGSALAAVVFFIALDRALTGERWLTAVASTVAFGSFMAGWNSLMIHRDARGRTSRDVAFENSVAELIGVMGAAWMLAPSLGHLRWQSLAAYSSIAIVALAVVRLITRRNVRGEDPRDLFA